MKHRSYAWRSPPDYAELEDRMLEAIGARDQSARPVLSAIGGHADYRLPDSAWRIEWLRTQQPIGIRIDLYGPDLPDPVFDEEISSMLRISVDDAIDPQSVVIDGIDDDDNETAMVTTTGQDSRRRRLTWATIGGGAAVAGVGIVLWRRGTLGAIGAGLVVVGASAVAGGVAAWLLIGSGKV